MTVSKVELENLLQQHFGHEGFRPGQYEAISAILAGENALVMLPTGSGKSLCYQLPSYLLTGSIIIVSPLLSLMQDQIAQLNFQGEKSVLALNSFLTSLEKQQALHHLNDFRFIFVSPEMLQQERVLVAIKKIEISLFVVDEAHCIAQWGPDFRPDYLHLGDIRKKLGEPVTLALTATATPDIRHAIITSLHLGPKTQALVYSVDRPNIALYVEKCHVTKKLTLLTEFLPKVKGPGIIYFSSKKIAENVAKQLKELLNLRIAVYHGDLENIERMQLQQQFLADQIDIICATSAFGMGINKENIRFVIHYHLPANLESYLQEIGRAGRDQQLSIALLLYAQGDEQLPRFLQESDLPTHAEVQAFYQDGGKLTQVPYFIAGESQQRLVVDYVQQSKSQQALLDFIDRRKKEKQQKLKDILNFVAITSCRRNFLLEYFDEDTFSLIDCLCDNCQKRTWQTYISEQSFLQKEYKESINSSLKWQDIIKKMF